MVHRGLDRMLAAESAGAAAIEVDVQQLADGQLVAFHNASAVDGDRWLWVRDQTRAELEGVVGPLLDVDDLVESVGATSLGLYLELKAVDADGVRRSIDSVVAQGFAARCVIGSFRHDIVAAVAADGRVCASALFRDKFSDPLALATDLGCSVVHPCFDGSDGMLNLMRGDWMDRLHNTGLRVVGWNSNDRQVHMAMSAIGIDVLCTDKAELLLPEPDETSEIVA